MKHINDGWHSIAGCDVYVEDGRVVRGTKTDSNGYEVSAYPYRKNARYGGWDNCSGLTVSAFSAGMRRGTIDLK